MATYTELATRAQQDARRCHMIYMSWRQHWEDGTSYAELSDVIVWQYRAKLASEHALVMLEIVLNRSAYHVD